jgi:2-succinyl-6-hydroxy-2,4-cyclohexadiene-1-carboxylate synthase
VKFVAIYKPKMNSLPIEQRMLEANGLTYRIDICGDGPTLLLLHGFTGSRKNWRPHLPVFGQHFQTIAVDLLGHGETAVPSIPHRYQIEKAAADLTAIIEQIATPPVHLLGYSMGGRLALYFACRYPDYVNKLILESASPGLKTAQERTERQQRDEALAGFIEREGIAAFVDRWQQLPLWESQKQVETAVRQTLRQQRLQNNPTGLAHSLRGMGTGVQPSLWPHLGQIATPTLLLCGELDNKFVTINREMATLMLQAQLKIVPQAGHTVHLERPLAFQQQCRHFLLSAE